MTDTNENLQRWVRSAVAALYDHGEQLTILCSDGAARRLDGATAELARALLDALSLPRTFGELERAIGETFELASGGGSALVRELVEQLHGWGAVQALTDDAATRSGTSVKPCGDVHHRRARVVLGICGAVRSAFTPGLVSSLLARGLEVQVVATDDALRFVTPAAVEVLTHRPLVSSMWQRDEAGSVPHIDLSRWADLMVIAPTSATTLARLACGDFSSVLSAIALSTRAPVVLCPSMNEAMRTSPAVQRNLAQLADDGFYLVHPRWSLEVADAPQRRTPMMGGAPSAERISDVVMQILGERPARAADASATTVDEWDALFRADASPAWHSETLDDDLAQALADQRPPPARLLDVGSGSGTVAIEAARRGYRATALDLSSVAIERARQRDDAGAVLWLRGDITDCPIRGSRFDVIVDRGCLHCLAPAAHALYAHTVANLLADDGLLLLKVHPPRAEHDYRTSTFDADAICALFGPAGLRLASCRDSDLGEAPALFAQLVRER